MLEFIKSFSKLSAVNCGINDFSGAALNLALENNVALRSLNLESNRY